MDAPWLRTERPFFVPDDGARAWTAAGEQNRTEFHENSHEHAQKQSTQDATPGSQLIGGHLEAALRPIVQPGEEGGLHV